MSTRRRRRASRFARESDSGHRPHVHVHVDRHRRPGHRLVVGPRRQRDLRRRHDAHRHGDDPDAGTHRVALQVTDNLGATSIARQSVVVNAPPSRPSRSPRRAARRPAGDVHVDRDGPGRTDRHAGVGPDRQRPVQRRHGRHGAQDVHPVRGRDRAPARHRQPRRADDRGGHDPGAGRRSPRSTSARLRPRAVPSRSRQQRTTWMGRSPTWCGTSTATACSTTRRGRPRPSRTRRRGPTWSRSARRTRQAGPYRVPQHHGPRGARPARSARGGGGAPGARAARPRSSCCRSRSCGSRAGSSAARRPSRSSRCARRRAPASA